MNTVKSLLNQLCGATDGVRRDIESQLKKHFIDPFYVSRSPSLPENDKMKTEARIVSDAFEAVTNGMYDEDILNQLEKVTDTSFFSDWKYLTESLFYLYSEDFGKADETFRKIAVDSVPHLVSSVFYKIISKDKISSITGMSETEKHFINNIIKESLSIKTNLDQIESNLIAEQEDRFVDNITLLLSDLYAKDQNISKKLAAWGLKQLSIHDMSPSMLLGNIKLIFGESESYRLTAISFRNEDPELSLIFFTKAALYQLRNNSADKNHIDAYIEIIGELLIEIEKNEDDSDSDDEMTEQINNILIVLEREINLYYPALLTNMTIREKVFNSQHKNPDDILYNKIHNNEIPADKIISAAEKIITVHTAENFTDNKIPDSSVEKEKIAGNPVQLELFF